METISRETLPSAILSRLKEGERLLVAIAGPPGAGKSTLSQQLRDALNKGGDGPSAIVPMDGFHLDNAILDQRNLRSRKGSPPTFDCAGFEMLLKRLRVADEDIVIPVFDRTLDLSRAGASMVLAKHRILIVEGNYLLLDEAPWSGLNGAFDYSIFVDPGIEMLERRLLKRWYDHGYDDEAAREKAFGNDIPNARRVIGCRRPVDLLIRGF